jgi:shikimate kinase
MNASVPPSLVLAGFMGTGKSTVGALIAQRLAWPFIDTDVLIEQAAGMSVRDIFSTQGEAAFRLLETEACARAVSKPPCVISTGGGALLSDDNRRTLEAGGVMVLLSCEPYVLESRLRASAVRGERPLLDSASKDRIVALLEARQQAYSAIPWQVDTTQLSPAEAAERVLDLYRRATAPRTVPLSW